MDLKNKLAVMIARWRWMSKRLRTWLINLLSPGLAGNLDFETPFFGFIYRGNTRNLIDRKVLFSGCHECDVLAFIRDFLCAHEGSVCVDIGANIGHHALFMSRYARRVFAFELYKPVRELMLARLTENNVSNVLVQSVALGERNEQKSFFSPPEANLGTGSFVEEFSDANQSSGVLDVRRMDDIVDSLDTDRIDFIKLDVEGYEKQTLAGAAETLACFRPVVLFESSIRIQDSLHSLHEIRSMFPQNYEFYRFSHQGKRRHGKYLIVDLNQELMDSRDELTILAVPGEISVPMSTANRIVPG
jgi:FkbM family methyltransferase